MDHFRRWYSTWTDNSGCEVIVLALRKADDVVPGEGILSYLVLHLSEGS